MKPKTIFQEAKELVADKGKCFAIDYYQKKVDNLETPKNFSELCRQSAYITVVEYINANFGNDETLL